MSLADGYIVQQEIKSMLKVYPKFARLHEYATPFPVPRFDYSPQKKYNPNKKKWPKPDPEDYERSSLARAIIAVQDIILANPWELFVTFTFAKDRQNVDGKKKQLQFWLNNQRNLHGKFAYLLVPEFHGDKKSIHFHGLFHGYKGQLVDSGKKDKGEIVYNIGSYRGGFTTAKKVDEHIEKIAGYITKYITKEMPRFKNKQRYWCSMGLIRPFKILNPVLTAEDREQFTSIFKGKTQEIFQAPGQFSKEDIERMSNYSKVDEDTLWVAEM